MDLRTIMNEASGPVRPPPSQAPHHPQSPSTGPPPPPPHQQSPLQHRGTPPRGTSFGESLPAASPGDYRARPPQPPSLQAAIQQHHHQQAPPQHHPHQSPGPGTPGYGVIQSPYQHGSTGAINSSPYPVQSPPAPPHPAQQYRGPPPPPPPPHPQHPQHPSTPRESYPSTTPIQQSPYGAIPSPSPYTPSATIPAQHDGAGIGYFQHQRTQSNQSAGPTPPANFNGPPPPPSHNSRESPTISQMSHPQMNQYSPYQQQHHPSQPGTPLGPPQHRPSPQAQHQRPPSSGFDQARISHSSSPYAAHHASPVAQSQVLRDSRSDSQIPRPYTAERERSVSVSPKTIPHNIRQSSVGSVQDLVTPAKRKQSDRTSSFSEESPYRDSYDSRAVIRQTTPSTTVPPVGKAAKPMYAAPRPLSSQSVASAPRQSNSPRGSAPPRGVSQDVDVPMRDPPSIKQEPSFKQEVPVKREPDNVPDLLRPAKRKRRRYDEVPIFARKAPRTSGMPPPLPSGQEPVVQPSVRPPGAPLVRADSNGHGPPQNGAPPPISHVPEEKAKTHWEPSITNVIPHDEIVHTIANWLVENVRSRMDLLTGPHGIILEVEAKLGMIIDDDTKERLRLPVLSECILNKAMVGKTMFKSSMTLRQHKAMNEFLNDAVKKSFLPNPAPGSDKPRVPVDYAHKKELDSFYRIPVSNLPPIIQQNINSERDRTTKVRVTTDQKTGQIINKIIKSRVADVEIYSPRTNLDWRLSINLEMNYTGDVSELTETGHDGFAKKGGERNKDRMSYRHQAYQIDLTQVADSASSKSDMHHELEVELSTAELRRQVDLACNREPNRYEDLVQGFVDNVRILTRAVPPST